ncbi:hypothetical protein ACLOJK_014729 [Asimina triloba]
MAAPPRPLAPDEHHLHRLLHPSSPASQRRHAHHSAPISPPDSRSRSLHRPLRPAPLPPQNPSTPFSSGTVRSIHRPSKQRRTAAPPIFHGVRRHLLQASSNIRLVMTASRNRAKSRNPQMVGTKRTWTANKSMAKI